MLEPDPALVRAAASGDQRAFEALVRSTQADVWRFLRHLVADDDLARELAQDTYLKVYRSLSTYRFESRFSSWLFRVARNVAMDEHRSRQRRARRAQLLEQRERLRYAGRAGSPIEVRHELRAAVASLDLRLREPFVLVEVFGMTYGEAASVLGIPDGTVKSRLFHARRQLVEWLTAGSADDGATGQARSADDGATGQARSADDGATGQARSADDGATGHA